MMMFESFHSQYFICHSGQGKGLMRELPVDRGGYKFVLELIVDWTDVRSRSGFSCMLCNFPFSLYGVLQCCPDWDSESGFLQDHNCTWFSRILVKKWVKNHQKIIKNLGLPGRSNFTKIFNLWSTVYFLSSVRFWTFWARSKLETQSFLTLFELKKNIQWCRR